MSTTFLGMHIPPVTNARQLADSWRVLCEYPDFTPAKYNTHEPIRTPFDADRIDEISQRLVGSDGIYWKGKIRATWGCIYLQHGKGKQTGEVWIATDAEKLSDPNHLTSVFQKLTEQSGCTYGYLHYLTQADAEKGWMARSVSGVAAKQPPSLSITRYELARCIPDLYWANVFGPQYLALFGRDRLLSAPAATVKEIAPDTVYIQLSDNILDFQTRYNEIDSLREHVKKHLGADCFFDYEALAKGAYRVPKLGWHEEPRAPMTLQEIAKWASYRSTDSNSDK